MIRSFMKSVFLGAFCCVLLWVAAAHGQGDTVTEPEKCLYRGAPNQTAYLQEENLALMVNEGGVYAFDVASGEQRWHRYLVSRNGCLGAQFGKRQVLGWSGQGVFLLDAVTGKETWWRNDTQCGGVRSASLSPDESRIVAVCERGVLLYGVNDRSRRVLPALREWCGWLPGGNAMMFSGVEWGRENGTRRWQILDPASGRVTLCREEPGSWFDPAPVFSSLGQVAEWSDNEQGGGTLKIRDARSGAVLHEFGNVGALSQTLYWLKDGKRLFCPTADRKEARVIDAETGAVQFALSGEGHCFAVNPPFEDGAGTVWVFSKDGTNHRYAWKLAPDGTPIRVLDGTRIAPSYFWSTGYASGRLATTSQEEDRLWIYAAYDMDSMNKLAEWRCRIPKPIWGGFLANKALTHVACSCRATLDSEGHPRNQIFSLHVLDRETPVRTGPGSVRAISPDGKYLAVQTDDKEACLYDAELDRILSVFTVKDEPDSVCRMSAVFSDDGKRMALNTTKGLEVTDLSEGFARRPMAMPPGEIPRVRGGSLQFSRDGARLLCVQNNCARLFDPASGALLHSFEETERFAYPYAEGQGFFGGLFTMAKDWAGVVTDRFKPDTGIEGAFVDGGARIVTHASGQVIRVWDAESGGLLRTIRTGLPEKRNGEGRINNQILLSANGRFAFSSNWDRFAPAVLWSVADGAALRRYQLRESSWGYGLPTDDGKAVIVSSNMNLYRWSGIGDN